MNLKRNGKAAFICLKGWAYRQRAACTAPRGVVIAAAALSLFFSAVLLDHAFGMGAALRSGEGSTERVVFVYDGDTIRTANGLIIRYIGIDTPERGELFHLKARNRNIELVKGKEIELKVCKGEPKDKYGRTLGWVYVDGRLVNAVLLEEGLGVALIIPPCGTEKRKELLKIEQRAKEAKVGLWGS